MRRHRESDRGRDAASGTAWLLTALSLSCRRGCDSGDRHLAGGCGSGVGGSARTLAAEKGHRVPVLECGSRFADEDFAKTTWDAARYNWMPKSGTKGIFRLTLFRDIFVASGCGVGGGSLGDANTL